MAGLSEDTLDYAMGLHKIKVTTYSRSIYTRSYFDFFHSREAIRNSQPILTMRSTGNARVVPN